MDGNELRRLVGEPNQDVRATNISEANNEQVSAVLSHLMTNYDFNSWQYDILTEACTRLSLFPDEQREVEDL